MIFTSSAFQQHERVIFCNDRDSGLQAIVAIHDSTLGPALGGCRFWHYESEAHAIDDVLRLAQGMTFKNAVADLPLGGGKAVILADEARTKTPAMLRAFGRFIESLDGRYITAEDVGFSVEDIGVVGSETRHVAGHAAGTGDPSPMTAYGVYHGMLASVKHRFGRDSMRDMRVAIQGVGQVGWHLCELLHREGVKLVVCDVDETRVSEAVSKFDATAVAPDRIFDQDVDVFSPCALGSVLNDLTIDRLRASAIAGAANNLLAAPRHGEMLRARGIVYAPDYVINAGGVIDIAAGREDSSNPESTRRQVEAIGARIAAVLERADREDRPTGDVADDLALERLARARSVPKLRRPSKPPSFRSS
jgi:leucine dehydrogenase